MQSLPSMICILVDASKEDWKVVMEVSRPPDRGRRLHLYLDES